MTFLHHRIGQTLEDNVLAGPGVDESLAVDVAEQFPLAALPEVGRDVLGVLGGEVELERTVLIVVDADGQDVQRILPGRVRQIHFDDVGNRRGIGAAGQHGELMFSGRERDGPFDLGLGLTPSQ